MAPAKPSLRDVANAGSGDLAAARRVLGSAAGALSSLS